MPYTATYRIGYSVGVTELTAGSNVFTSQTSPYVSTLSGSVLKYTSDDSIIVTNFTSTGNSILTTGDMFISAPVSNTDFYGGYRGSVLNCQEIIGGNIIGQVLSLNTINVQTNATTTGNLTAGYLYAEKALTFGNTISAGNIYAGSYIGRVTGASVSTLGSLTATSTITLTSNTTGNILTTGTVTGSGTSFGNLIAGSNNVTVTAPGFVSYGDSLFSNVTVSGQAQVNRLVAGTIVGTFTSGPANSLVSSAPLTMYGPIVGGVRGDIQTSGRVFTNEYIGRLDTTQPIEASTVYSNVSAASLSAYTNNLTGVTISGSLVGPVQSWSNNVTVGQVQASQVFVGQMSFTDVVLTSGNLTAQTFIGAFSGQNVITSGTVTSTAGNLFGILRGSNVVTLTDSLVSNAIFATVVTYANSIPTINVTAGSIIAGSMNTFTNSISTSRVSGNFVGPLTSTGTDIFSTGSVQAKNFIGLIDAGSNTIQTTGSVFTQLGLVGNINTFANSIVTQGVIAGTFYGKYNGLGPIRSNALLTVTGTSSISNIIGGSNTITVTGTMSGNFIGAIQTYGNTISATGGLSGNIVTARFTAFQNNIVTDAQLSYGKDLTKSNYGNVASYSNVLPIQRSLAHYYSNVVSRQPWWSTSSTPMVSYVYTQGLSGYSSGVLLPDGRVIMVPGTSFNVGVFDTKTGIFSNVIPTGLSPRPTGWGWTSGVLLPNSNVAFLPGSNNYIGIYDPYNHVVSLGPFISTSDAFRGGVLLPNGNVLCIPYNTFVFTEFNPENPSAAVRQATIGGPGSSPFLWSGTLLPNGNVICAPYSGNFVLYDYRLPSPSVSTDLVISFSNKHAGSVLLPSGNVLCVPNAAGYGIGQVSPAGVYSNTVSSFNFGLAGYQGACLLGNGKVLFGPGSGSNAALYDTYSDTASNVQVGLGYGAPLTLPDGRAILPPVTSSLGVAIVSGVTQINEHLTTSSYFNKF
jgi:hypothetical protein